MKPFMSLKKTEGKDETRKSCLCDDEQDNELEAATRRRIQEEDDEGIRAFR